MSHKSFIVIDLCIVFKVTYGDLVTLTNFSCSIDLDINLPRIVLFSAAMVAVSVKLALRLFLHALELSDLDLFFKLH